MKKTILLLYAGILWLLLAPAPAKAYELRNLLQKKAGQAEVKASLLPKEKWISYPAYKDRQAWDALTASFRGDLISKGEQYLDYTWKVVKATDYLAFETSGSRVAMEQPFGDNNSALSHLLLAELAEGKGRFIPQIINGVWHSCEMSSWVLSAHLPVQRSKRSLPDFQETIIDLTSGDLGSFLSWTYYFLHDEFDKVNPVIAKRLRKELQDRILDPYMARSDYWWQAFDATPTTMVNNWNPWCNFNVLTCFLLLETDADKLAAAVHRTMQSVDRFINYNHSDGACEEGPSYWGHAAGKMYDYLQLLSYATGGRISIFHEPMIRNMGEYIVRSYVGNGWVVNFADASAKGGGDAGLIHRYGRAVKSTDMQQFAAYLLERDGKFTVSEGRDFFRTIENLTGYTTLRQTKAAQVQAPYSWYPETQFCYMQNGRGLFLAAKGGHNNESHNHNDVGTFSLYYQSVPMLIDVGVGTYTRQTFSSERYSIWTMQSNYHNLPLVNGKAQQYGRQFHATRVQFDSAARIFSLDISKAYPAEAGVQQWLRRFAWNSAGALVLTDQFGLQQPTAANVLHFMTWARPDTSQAGTIRLEKEGKAVALQYDPRLFNLQVEAIDQTDTRLARIWGKTLYRVALQAKKVERTGSYRILMQPL